MNRNTLAYLLAKYVPLPFMDHSKPGMGQKMLPRRTPNKTGKQKKEKKRKKKKFFRA